MPAKFKPSAKKYVRGVAPSKLPVEHFYLKQTPKEELFKYINNPSGNDALPTVLTTMPEHLTHCRNRKWNTRCLPTP